MNIELHCGDCLEVMRSIPDNSIDAIITDPPYGTTACKWDSVIPFEPMWEQLKRIIKPNGAIVLFGSQPFTSALIMSNLEHFKYNLIWKKNTVTLFAHAKNRPLKSYEDIIVFSKGSINHENLTNNRMAYFPQGLKEVNRVVKGTGKGGRDNSHRFNRPSNKQKYIRQFEGYPRDILEFDKTNISKHPTEKPVALLEYLIKTYTNEGETVLDFTMGSGTTGHAAVNLNRHFIGIEKDPEYFEIARKRIENAQHDLEVLFGEVA